MEYRKDIHVGWATQLIDKLKDGETVKCKPRGNSMSGKIESGQEVTIKPLDDETELEVGNIVLCRVKGKEYLHLIKAIQGERYQIGNNKGHINGWIGTNSIFGVYDNE